MILSFEKNSNSDLGVYQQKDMKDKNNIDCWQLVPVSFPLSDVLHPLCMIVPGISVSFLMNLNFFHDCSIFSS